MKALSIRQPWAELIRIGEKSMEIRSWRTKYRGKLLICSSKSKEEQNDFNKKFLRGFSICVVELEDVIIFEEKHQKFACTTHRENLFAWKFKLLYEVKPISISGKLGIFEVDHNFDNVKNDNFSKETFHYAQG